jgi:Prokaryotic Cytochrome C oxidase subunit IV
MAAAARHREWGVWLVCAVLVGATLLGFALAEGLAPARIAASGAILLAALKIHLVFDHYMELRWHHRPLRAALAAWLALVTAILLITYWA